MSNNVDKSNKLISILNNLPNSPGVYLMRSAGGDVLYIGKAINLKRRVSSYFRHFRHLEEPKLSRLVPLIQDISIIRTESEAEALIVEAKLIRKYRPQFNIDLKFNDRYPYIKINLNENFPLIEVTRHKNNNELNEKIKYIGPFVSAHNMRELMRLIQRFFPLRVCKRKLGIKQDKRPCIEYSLGHSMGACAGMCSQAQYMERVQDIILLLEGKSPELITRLKSRMDNAAKSLNFEAAAKYRDAIKAVSQRLSPVLQKDFDTDTWSAMNNVREVLNLKIIPWRIDAFDISHISGHDTYGCCVVFEQGLPNKSLYRKFKIKSLDDGEIDDYKSMYETVLRRYRDVCRAKSPMPQLTLIDGGVGQLNAALKALDDVKNELNLTSLETPYFIALAEREEIIFTQDNNNNQPIKLNWDNPALQLLQRVRDEAHRFAVTTHRHARNARMRHSILEDIDGIGKRRAAQLLVKFGSVKNIANLSRDELKNASGISGVMADRILDYLSKNYDNI